MKIRKIIALIICAAMAVGIVSACGSSEPTDTTPDRPTIYVIVKAMGNAYWGILQAGAIDAGREFNANVIITGIPDEARIEDQITLLQNAVSARADAILIAVASSEAMAGAVEDAHDSGIPIILIDSGR